MALPKVVLCVYYFCFTTTYGGVGFCFDFDFLHYFWWLDFFISSFRPFTDDELAQFDIIVSHVKSHYGRNEYIITKNTPKLSSKDLAIICDKGNLAFGYTGDQKRLSVYTD